jgi:hypothetical protein
MHPNGLYAMSVSGRPFLQTLELDKKRYNFTIRYIFGLLLLCVQSKEN